MPLDSLLLEVLVDPSDRGPRWSDEERSLLLNPRRAIAYAGVDDIAVLLPDEGRAVDADELSELDAARAGAVETGAGRS